MNKVYGLMSSVFRCVNLTTVLSIRIIRFYFVTALYHVCLVCFVADYVETFVTLINIKIL